MLYDVVIVGGGPAGLSAALALGRARKSVLLCDAGVRRNAAATHIHNFVTRDGTPPEAFRLIAREDLTAYPHVEVRDALVTAVSGSKGAFAVTLGTTTVETRRILLGVGLLDQMLPIEGFESLWGRGIFQCPYCHGWEVKDRPWGYLALPTNAAHLVPFVTQLRGWTREVVVFVNGEQAFADEISKGLDVRGVRVEMTEVRRLVARGNSLESLELVDGRYVPCEALFVHPPQRQTELVRALGVELDEGGLVRVDPMRRETSVPGVYAAGDATTRMQGAVLAAASGVQAATALNLELTMELLANGHL